MACTCPDVLAKKANTQKQHFAISKPIVMTSLIVALRTAQPAIITTGGVQSRPRQNQKKQIATIREGINAPTTEGVARGHYY
jgi:hypothetical protein